jgi:hypothetical protein
MVRILSLAKVSFSSLLQIRGQSLVVQQINTVMIVFNKLKVSDDQSLRAQLPDTAEEDALPEKYHTLANFEIS